jgi:hypothetical protein
MLRLLAILLVLAGPLQAQQLQTTQYCTQGEITTGALIGGVLGLLGGTSVTAALLSRGAYWTVGEATTSTLLNATGGAVGGVAGMYIGGALACAIDAGKARMPVVMP